MLTTSDKDERDSQAHDLAQRHYSAEEGVTDIIRFTQKVDVELSHGEPIKLLEVNTNTSPSGIMPIQFAPSPSSGITYPTTIIEVTPEEFEQIKLGKLRLPPGWEYEEPIPREQ
jgi:hypothetical protein